MPQTLKREMRDGILDAALDQFARYGYRAASIARIAAQAGTAPGNIYRYFSNKRELFDAAIPPSFATSFHQVLDRRIIVPETTTDGSRVSPEALELLDFWIANRRQVIIVLDRADGSPYADFADKYVARLVRHAYVKIRAENGKVRITRQHRQLLTVTFDNTRRAIVSILAANESEAAIRSAIRGFWSYQIPGLNGLFHWIATARPRESR